MSLENFGLAGAPLDATNTGLVPVDQAVWFPGATDNYLAIPDSTQIGNSLFEAVDKQVEGNLASIKERLGLD